MDLTAFGGAATVALTCAVIFLLIVRSYSAFTHTVASTAFPNSIMLVAAHRFLSFPVALDLQAMIVEAAASIAVAQIVGIVVLEGFFGH